MCVCADVPEAKDLETWLEVGGFAWNWMEPPLGTISFVLLCMQFARSQLQNLGIFIYLCMYVCMYVEKSRSLVDSWHCSEYDCSLFFPLYSIEGITMLV